MSRARRVLAIAVCAGLAVGLGSVAALRANPDLHRGSGPVHQATAGAGSGRGGSTGAAPSVPLAGERPAQIRSAQDLLSARVMAVRAQSKSAWMATVDPADSAFRRRQSVEFDNLIKLPLGQFSYGTVQPAPALAAARVRQVGPRAWAAAVTGTYQLAGFDRAAQSFDLTYTLVQRPQGWRIADDVDGATASQLWDLPGMRVLRGRSGIVIGNAPVAQMRDYSAMADSAVRRVSAVWGPDWSSHVVVVTPATTQEFANLLSRSDDGGLNQVAAITQGVIDPGQRAQGDRVVINPAAFMALQTLGRRVVITHELAHVAARSSTTSAVPIWLAEGMADYVGYSGIDLTRQHVAAALLALVRAGKGPDALPTAGDFDPSRTTIAPSYSASWLAVCHLVDLYGQARVVAFYRAVGADSTSGRHAPLDPGARAAVAFPRAFGVTQGQFVAGWRRYLRTLAHEQS